MEKSDKDFLISGGWVFCYVCGNKSFFYKFNADKDMEEYMCKHRHVTYVPGLK